MPSAKAADASRIHLAAVAVIVAHAAEAIPLLEQRFRSTQAAEQLECARVLGVLGASTGAQVLAAAVDAYPGWDAGMAWTSQRKTGNLFSDLDRLVIALGVGGGPDALSPLLRKLEQLEPDSELSHYKAISLALWNRAEPAAASSLVRLLAQPGFTGHATPTPTAGDPPRAAPRLVTSDPDAAANRSNLNRAVKELSIAALLYRCGDSQGRGEAVLRQYTRDIHGHLARYARHALGEE